MIVPWLRKIRKHEKGTPLKDVPFDDDIAVWFIFSTRQGVAGS